MPNPVEEGVLVYLSDCCTLSQMWHWEIELCATCWPRPSQSFKRQQTLLFTTFMSSLSSSTGWGHWSTMHPLPYHCSHQYDPRPPHLRAMHVVLLQCRVHDSISELWGDSKGSGSVIKNNLQIHACQFKSVTEIKLETCMQSWSHDIRWEASKSFRRFPHPDKCVWRGWREQNISNLYSMYCSLDAHLSQKNNNIYIYCIHFQ